MSQPSYDFVIIGGGSAGYAAARTAADLGLKVAIIDSATTLGGLCILRGCMPSKTILATAKRAREVRSSTDLAVKSSFLGIDKTALKQRKEALINEFAEYRQQQLASDKFDLLRGKGSLLSSQEVLVTPKEKPAYKITAKTILLATGSSIHLPSIAGLKEANPWTSDDVLNLDEIPSSVLILGGGAIACELACFYEGVGTKVTQIQRSQHLIKEADTDLAQALEKALISRGINLYANTEIHSTSRTNTGAASVTFLDKNTGQQHTITADQLVCALGRTPSTAGLNLENAGIQTTNNRPITDRSQLCQGSNNIWAAGDLAGPWELVHIAISQGEIAARNAARSLGILDGEVEQIETHAIYYGIFTDPEFAQVGLTEAECKQQNKAIRVATYPFDDHGKSLVSGESEGFVKVIAEENTEIIVGAALVGAHATDLLHSMALAVYLKLKPSQLVNAPWYHPTLHEIWSYPIEELAEHFAEKNESKQSPGYL